MGKNQFTCYSNENTHSTRRNFDTKLK